MPSPPAVCRRQSFDNKEDGDFPRKVSAPVVGRLVTRANSREFPILPPKRLSEKKEKAPSVRAQTMPRPIRANNDDDEGGEMFLAPTLNPITVAKMKKLTGLNQNQTMAGSEVLRRRQELQKAFQN